TRARQYSACRTFLRAAVERYPHDVWLHHDLYHACVSAQPPDYAEALRHMSAASVQWPECALFHLQIAECYANLGSYEQAIAAHPRKQLRSNAARPAMNCADGMGADAPPPAERPAYRKQPLDLLTAELAALGKLDDRAFVHRGLQHWLDDPDLASVRDAAVM